MRSRSSRARTAAALALALLACSAAGTAHAQSVTSTCDPANCLDMLSFMQLMW